MATDRFFHFISATAVASGLLLAAAPVLAEGGGADRAAMQEGTSDRGGVKPAEMPVVADVVPTAPLPPRRPKNLEADFAAAQPPAADSTENAVSMPVAVAPAEASPPQTAVAPQLAPASVINNPPVEQQASAGTVDTAPAHSTLPLAAQPVPVLPSSPQASLPLGSGMGMTGPAAWPDAVQSGQFRHESSSPTTDQAAEVSDETVVDVTKPMKGPLPPTRPTFASDNPPPSVANTNVELAESQKPTAAAAQPAGMALGSITVTQPKIETPAVVATEEPEAVEPAPFFASVPLPPVRPRLLVAPVALTSAAAPDGMNLDQQERTVEKIGYMPPPRGKSRLNHIIGDNADAANSLRSLISKHASANGIPYRLADAVVRVESRYNPLARNGPYMGLMQIHPRTASSLGYGGDARGLLEADTNLQYGIKYLAMAYRLAGGDTCGTIMRYQGGHRSVTMTAANRTYCNKVKMILAENHY